MPDSVAIKTTQKCYNAVKYCDKAVYVFGQSKTMPHDARKYKNTLISYDHFLKALKSLITDPICILVYACDNDGKSRVHNFCNGVFHLQNKPKEMAIDFFRYQKS